MGTRTSYLTIILLLVIVIVVLVNGCLERRQAEAYYNRVIADNNITRQFVDHQGRQITEASTNYITRNQLRESQSEVLDSLRKSLQGPIRTLERTARIMTETTQRLAIPVKDTLYILDGDTTRIQSFSYFNEWLNLKGSIVDGMLNLDYSLKGGFGLEYHWKPTGLFKPKELELTVVALDPAVKVNNIQQFQIIEQVPVWKKPGVAFLAGALTVSAVDLLIQSNKR